MPTDQDQEKPRTYLTSIMPTREMVDQYVSRTMPVRPAVYPNWVGCREGSEKATMALEIRLRFTHTKRIAVVVW